MAVAEPGPRALDVEVVFSPAPRELRRLRLALPAGSSLRDALRASGWPEVQELVDGARGGSPGLCVAVWGRVRTPDWPLRAGDRVEVLRALQVDPMQARRLRYEAAGGVQALRRQRLALQPKKSK